MKWYFWVIIAVLVITIIYFVYRKQVGNKLATNVLNGNFGDIANDAFSQDNLAVWSPELKDWVCKDGKKPVTFECLVAPCPPTTCI